MSNLLIALGAPRISREFDPDTVVIGSVQLTDRGLVVRLELAEEPAELGGDTPDVELVWPLDSIDFRLVHRQVVAA